MNTKYPFLVSLKRLDSLITSLLWSSELTLVKLNTMLTLSIYNCLQTFLEKKFDLQDKPPWM